jgi:hypothetical protein
MLYNVSHVSPNVMDGSWDDDDEKRAIKKKQEKTIAVNTSYIIIFVHSSADSTTPHAKKEVVKGERKSGRENSERWDTI